MLFFGHVIKILLTVDIKNAHIENCNGHPQIDVHEEEMHEHILEYFKIHLQ